MQCISLKYSRSNAGNALYFSTAARSKETASSIITLPARAAPPTGMQMKGSKTVIKPFSSEALGMLIYFS
jgi:hypothetical protein